MSLFKILDKTSRNYFILKSGNSLFKLIKQKRPLDWEQNVSDVFVAQSRSFLGKRVNNSSFTVVKVQQKMRNGSIDYTVW